MQHPIQVSTFVCLFRIHASFTDNTWWRCCLSSTVIPLKLNFVGRHKLLNLTYCIWSEWNVIFLYTLYRKTSLRSNWIHLRSYHRRCRFVVGIILSLLLFTFRMFMVIILALYTTIVLSLRQNCYFNSLCKSCQWISKNNIWPKGAGHILFQATDWSRELIQSSAQRYLCLECTILLSKRGVKCLKTSHTFTEMFHSRILSLLCVMWTIQYVKASLVVIQNVKLLSIATVDIISIIEISRSGLFSQNGQLHGWFEIWMFIPVNYKTRFTFEHCMIFLVTQRNVKLSKTKQRWSYVYETSIRIVFQRLSVT